MFYRLILKGGGYARRGESLETAIMLLYPDHKLIRVTEGRYLLASFVTSIIPSIEICIFDTLKQYRDPSYADYMSPFGIAVGLMPFSFFLVYLGSRLLGRFDQLSCRNVTLTFYVPISLLLVGVTAGHLHSVGQIQGLLQLLLVFVVPAVTAGYVWWLIAGFRNSTSR
jgi:hypothetical protein